MLRSRMRGSHRRGAKRPTMWFGNSNAWGGIAGTAVAAATLNTQGMILSATPIGTEQPEIDRLTVLRIRGQLVVQANDAVNSGLWIAGIYVADTVSGAGVNALDPSLAADAMRSDWLWLRTGYLPAVTSAGVADSNATDGMYGCEVDIRVRRIMRPGTELRFAYKAQRASLYTLNLRTLITRSP